MQLGNELARTRRTYLLRLHPPDALRGFIERLTDVAGGARKRLDHLPCRFVAEIADAPCRFGQHLILAPLQSPMTPRTFAHFALAVGDASKLFVAILDGRLRRPTTDENDLLSVGCGDERIHPQIHADDTFLVARFILRLADEAYDAIRQPDFHETTGQCHSIGQTDTKRATRAVWQN
ncbi:MAG TPA: hypothetical protein VH393_13825 [Ktedonobacterales bacterium]